MECILLIAAPTANGWSKDNPFVAVAVGVIAAIIVLILGENLKRKLFSPKLELDADDAGRFVPTHSASESVYRPAVYIRVPVKNIGNAVASNCRAYLTSVSGDLNPDTLPYHDMLRLRAAYEDLDSPQDGGVDIPCGITTHFDLVSNQGNGRISIEFARIKAMNNPDNLALVAGKGQRIFRVMVTCDESSPLRIDVEFFICSDRSISLKAMRRSLFP